MPKPPAARTAAAPEVIGTADVEAVSETPGAVSGPAVAAGA